MGAAKIKWGSDGDFDTCRAQLAKYVHDPSELAGLCAHLHHRATGFWPGHAPGESKSGHKKSTTVVAAGIVLKADDTGRVLMVQRSIHNKSRPEVAGLWEFPGGGLDDGEDSLQAAEREFEEEVGVPLPKGKVVGSWTTTNGYQGFCYVIKHEDAIELNDARSSLDNSGDKEIENVARWNINDLQNNPAIRPEVQSCDWALIGHAQKALGKADAQETGRAKTLRLGQELGERVVDFYAPKIQTTMSDVDGIEAAIAAASVAMGIKGLLSKVGPKGYVHGWIYVGAGEDRPFDNFDSKTKNTVSVTANRAITDAKSSEPQVTKDLTEVSKGVGGQMEGLEYNVKGQSSLEDKITEKMIEAKTNGVDLSPQQAQNNIHDVLRYTMTTNGSNYTQSVKDAVKQLQDRGYSFDSKRWKNTWGPDNPYRGLNTTMVTPDGKHVELQFHTPESFEGKQAQHSDYEEERRSSTSADRKTELQQAMAERSRALSSPVGAEGLTAPA